MAFLFCVFHTILVAQEDEFDTTAVESKEAPQATPEVAPTVAADLAEGIRKNTSIEKPLDLRDPFKSPPLKKKSEEEQKRDKSILRNGIFTNLPTIESLEVQNLKVLGTLMGSEPRALVADKNMPKNAIMIKEGDKINNGKVELKAILPKGVIFVEQFTNPYGQIDLQETIVPISE